MIRALCKNQTFMLRALDGSVMFTKPNDVNEIPEKFTVDPTYKMAVSAGVLEPIKTDKQVSANTGRTVKGSKKEENSQTDGAGEPNETGGDDKGTDDAK